MLYDPQEGRDIVGLEYEGPKDENFEKMAIQKIKVLQPVYPSNYWEVDKTFRSLVPYDAENVVQYL